MMEIVRKFLSADELQPRNTRYNEATDTVQSTNDGGTTWYDTPSLDPRTQYQQPPVDTADPKCDAAARMSAELENLVMSGIAGVDNAMGAIQIGNIILTGVSLMLGAPLFSTLIFSAANYFITTGSTVLHSEFDTFDWDALTCQFLCVVTDEGRLDADGYAVIVDYLNTLSIVQSGLIGINMTLLGWGGLSDYAAARTETGDCSGCDNCMTCWTFADLGTNTIAGNFTVSTYSAATLTPTLPLLKIRIDWHMRPNSGATYQEGYFSLLVPGGSAPLIAIPVGDTPDGFYEEEYATPQTLGSLYAQVRSWYVGGSNYPDLTLTLWYSPSWSGSWAQGASCD